MTFLLIPILTGYDNSGVLQFTFETHETLQPVKG